MIRPTGRSGLYWIVAFAVILFVALGSRPHSLSVALKDYLYLSPYASTFRSSQTAHPIDHLLTAAAATHKHRRSQETFTVDAAAKAYRERRGRHPPPGFDMWTQYALSHSIPMIEQMFDQIYHDLEPYWSLPPSLIRKRTSTWHQIISIRNGSAEMRAIRPDTIQWLPLWHEALGEIASFLPDVDMAFNDLDEPRVMVPWELVNASLHVAAKTRHTSLAGVNAEFPKYDPLPPIDPENPPNRQPFVNESPYWDYIRNACHPHSEARSASFSESVLLRPPIFNTSSYTKHTSQGYVGNATLSRSPCSNPELQYIHGTLFAPSIPSTTTDLFPLFGGCKISGVSNEILVPAAYYFNRDAQFEGSWGDDKALSQQDISWEDKMPITYWRGAATGGRHKTENWRHFHRHRFVAMLNASHIAAATGESVNVTDNAKNAPPNLSWAQNFALPNASLYPMRHISDLVTYTRKHADAAFTHLMCFPQEFSLFTPGTSCEYTSPFYSTATSVPLPDFIQQYRVLPDIDGQSYSGRFRAYMRYSGALVVKATVFDDWTIASERLQPWTHYVPMTAEMQEWWGLMNYFLPDHDREPRVETKSEVAETEAMLEARQRTKQARTIAEDGRDWAKKVLRKDDMLAYIYRLVLEYARVCAEDRLSMGWVEDLAQKTG